jgi:predicted DNA-binding transcriptional regulator YafY
MKTESASQSSERVLALLILLLQQECRRQDIVAQIPAYSRATSTDAQHKMLDRDFSTLERAGVQISRRESDSGLFYCVHSDQFEKGKKE